MHAIIFVTPFDADTRQVNARTGRYGFGHVAIWGGDVSDNDPIVIDSSIGAGVTMRRLRDCTRGAPTSTLFLDAELGKWVYCRAMGCIGAPYDYGGLILSRSRDDAFTCSGLVACALPLQLAVRCRPRRGPTSPNDVARGLGVPPWSPKP